MDRSVAIIGAGQLGSRHLQGILKSKRKFKVFVVDPDKNSILLCISRAKEIEHSHQITYLNKLSDLPIFLNLVIVATNSNVRLNVLKDLLSHSNVKVLVLEKVLFQSVPEYVEAKYLLSSKSSICYVNHPRRMQKGYKNLKKILKPFNHEIFEIKVYGSNWGIGCNGLHFLDLISYILTDKNIKYSSKNLAKDLIESKRKGFYEFRGSLHVKTVKGNKICITDDFSDSDITTPLSICIMSKSVRIFIQEGINSNIIITFANLNFKLKKYKLELLFQSELSKKIVDSVLDDKNLELTKFSDAMENHIGFIKVLNNHIENITGIKTSLCPIT